jgi:FixJ family two-component response regulator
LHRIASAAFKLWRFSLRFASICWTSTRGKPCRRPSPAALRHFNDAEPRPDLLIAGVNLKETSGIRVALELRSLHSDMNIILTSGHTPGLWPDEDVAALSEVPPGRLSVVQKPFVVSALLEAVSQFVPVASESLPMKKTA